MTQMFFENKNGITVRELREILNNWPDIDYSSGEDTEVWISTREYMSSPLTSIAPLNFRQCKDGTSADILLEVNEL